ncbi:MAG TPA: arylsulfatase [Bryobacteraceae bacterium]|jgi:arylsulfatase A-like enzyme|nr:arylsulfatase [Bryobacteraceae bacterium]
MGKVNRREFLKQPVICASSAGAILAQGLRKRPNIIWIMADDLGYADLGCYGQKTIQTPNIDRLAAEGMRFTNAYAGCTVCAPSRNVLMTGLHGGHTTVRSNPGGVGIRESDVTVAQVLKSAGYKTGCFGKWGLGDIGTAGVPWKHGFDQFFGYLHQIHAHFYYPPYLWDNDRKFPLAGNRDGKRATYSHDIIASRSLDFIRTHKEGRFFLYVPFTIPHMEYLVPPDSVDQYRSKLPEVAPIPPGHYAAQPYPRAAYAGMVTRMDRDVGKIMALLKELDLDKNTVVFFTSDNGPIFPQGQTDFFKSAGPLRGHKQQMYEGGIRVPMIARWPGRIRSETVSDLPWYFADLLPTAAELAGVKPPPGLDGMSVVPTLLGAKVAGHRQTKHEFMYWELPPYDNKTGGFRAGAPMQAVRMGDWKAVRPKADAPLELYNLKQDPGETTDVAARNPKIRERIEEYLKTARVEPPLQPEPKSEWHF